MEVTLFALRRASAASLGQESKTEAKLQRREERKALRRRKCQSTVARVQPGFHPGYGAAGEFPEEFEATTCVAAPPNPNQQPGA